MTSIFGTGEISTSDEYRHEIPGFIRVHKDGRCERFVGTKKTPAGSNPSTGVQSKDVIISPETNLSARIFVPKTADTGRKLPLMVYFHGGGFVIETTVSPVYNRAVDRLTAELNVITVSVDYRLAPEYQAPTQHNDSWEAINWVASQGGHDPWLNKFADFNEVFFAGDSAGANIAHNMALRVGLSPVDGINLTGIILLHPYFGGSDPIGSELGEHKQLKKFTDQFWNIANSSSSGLDDPLFNPGKETNLAGLGCSKILLAVAEKDSFRDRGLYYKELMDKSGWSGKLEMIESKGEDHAFFLFDNSCESACTLYTRVCTFINDSNNN
ncbi:hypothetical protein QVD17_05740 [Tagetes erecta]|uniref:Alpha/beta hydrolase fold-3 domain-containing protein n=1 Tax=Tagetes erecta TaxID=13708 RepID=A0AAD8LM37_TARER|nr:hypothetical protein QVD17_05740 [Tagetes erecta]